VENAGGLTSLEALRAGLPVVSFQPIAGHGRENTAGMAAAGVSRLAANSDELLEALEELTSTPDERAAQVDAGWAMFRTGADHHVLEAVASTPPVRLPRRPAAYAVRVAAGLAAVAALGWAGLTSGVEVAAASVGAGVAHPSGGQAAIAYAGVRLNATELANPTVTANLVRMNLTAVVDTTTAQADPTGVRQLAALHVNVVSGGRGRWANSQGHEIDPTLWTRARGDAKAGLYLEQLIGTPVTELAPGRRVNAWDLIYCGHVHSSLVIPNHTINVEQAASSPNPINVSPKSIYLFNGLSATPAQLEAVLGQLEAGLQIAHLTAVPFATLV
jgi:hypothetical protein